MESRDWAEMQDQADFKCARPEVVEELALRKSRQHCRRLVFDNDFHIHDHVQADSREWFSFVADRDNNLTVHPVASRTKFSLQCQRVHVFEETVAQSIVDVIKRTDDRLSYPMFEQRFGGHVIAWRGDVT